VNEDAFLITLLDSPTDELTWSALADWLDEDGQTQRAELLRLTRQLRSMPVVVERRNSLGSLSLPSRRRDGVRKRVVELLEAGVRPVVVERTNSLGMRFALVPPGRFFMGSPTGEPGRVRSEKLHEVNLTKPFWLGVFAVTQAQWETVMGKNPSSFRAGGGHKDRVAGMATSDFPVETVSWPDVHEFLDKLNALAGATDGGTYRLPSEAEWEYACRGGGLATSPFCLRAPSGSLCSVHANFDGKKPACGAPAGPNLNRPCPVGSYEPNPLGLYDVHGNVWEWVEDWFTEGYYNRSQRDDPIGPPNGSLRLARGGSWTDSGVRCRAAFRGFLVPHARQAVVGFRLAFTASE
jgi:uncharacterized protein (TIGR02996 family)